MFVADLLIAAYAVGMVVLGFRWGLFRRLVQLAFFCLGMFMAREMSVVATQNFGWQKGQYPVAAHFAVYLGIVVLMVAISEMLMAFYNGPLKFFNALIFDRFFGATAGLLFAAFQLSVILYLFGYAYSTQGPGGTGQPQIMDSFASSVSQSLLAKPLKGLQPVSTSVFGVLLPLEPGKYFAESFT